MEAVLNIKTVVQLKQICNDKGLQVNGNKQNLVERLAEYFRDHEDEAAQLGRENGGGNNDGNDENNDVQNNHGDQQQRKSVFSFKDIEESLDKFDGDSNKDPKQWISDFEAQSELFGWNDLAKLVYARRLLTGSAKLYASCELRPKTWTELKNGLTKEFEIIVNSALVHKKLSESKKKKDETFREFCYRMIDIATPAKIETAAVITYIVDGIPDVLNNKLFLYSSTTLNELKEKIRVYEEVIKKDVVKNEKTTNKEKEKEKSNDRKSSKSERGKKCFNCGSNQHESRECPDKDKGPKCFKCNQFGHKSNSCPEKDANKAKNNEKPATNILIVPDRRRVKKEITVNNKTVDSTFDTGSDINVVQKRAFERYNFGTMRKVNFAFDGVGAENRAMGYFDIKVVVDGDQYDDVCFVIQNQERLPEFIIGLSLINQGEITINSNGLSMKKISPNSNSIEVNSNDVNDDWRALPMCALMTHEEEIFPEVNHIRNRQVRDTVNNLVREYRPKKVKESPVELKIILTDEIPVYQRARRLPPKEKDEVSKQVKEWLKDGIIQPSSSDYAAAVVPVPKKDGTKRLCVDYRPINRKIIKDRYPLPIIDDQIDALQGAKVFSALDLANGFFHLPVALESRKYTSFITSDGQYEFLRAPFGLCLCPPLFMRFINTIFAGLIADGTVVPYMDDLVIPAQTEEEALQKLERVLKVAEEYGLNIKWKKCTLLQRKIIFLGYEIEDGRIRSAPAKTITVKNYSEPKNVKQIERFLGLTSYFRKFIPDYAIIAKPLNDLKKDGVKFVFGTEQLLAFEKLKEIITERPVLQLFRYGLETEVHTDASKYGLGAILFQRCNDDNKMHPVRYWSRKTKIDEQNNSSYELEVRAVVEALHIWRVYLLYYPFKVVTDCKAFVETMNNKNAQPKIARWAMSLQKFDFQIDHRAGNRMKHVDALSRVCIIQVNGVLESLKKNQQNDEHIKAIVSIIDEKGSYEDYELSNELLYRRVDGQQLIVVPEQMQFDIIRRAHEQGHFKTKKMEDIITREFFIPKLKDKIEKFVRNCVTCILTDRKVGKKEGLLHPIPKADSPLITFHMDHLGPMASTRKNYKHVLAIVDAFSKFVWIFPVKSTTSDETVKKLKIVTAVFGNPSQIITDKGTAFTGSDFESYCESNGIEVVHSTTGNPRGNGQVERINGIIIPVLAKLSIDNPEKWFQHTDKVQQFLNKTYQRSIGMSPFELLFGVPMKTKDDVELKSLIEQEIIESFVDDRELLRERAKNQILAVTEENKRTYNSKRKSATTYEVNDLVAIKRTQFGSSLKLQSKFFGPYKVIKSKGNDRYDVEKIGIHDGPYCTSTSADYMVKWSNYEDGVSSSG